MVVNDLISDMLVRINNGYNSKLNTVSVLYSKVCLQILALLYMEGFINGYYLTKEGTIVVKLKYHLNQNIFKGYQRISKPSRRVYYTAKKLKQVYYNKPFVVVSTKEGLLLHRYAILKNIGGEVLFALSYM
jgi:small subunit ribosomal protein S8